MSLRLTPVDTFFFKGQQTALSSNDQSMSGMFPPRPNTIYGALRSAFIHAHTTFENFYEGSHEEVKRWMGTPDELGDFQIDFCSLFFEGSPLLPLPLDYQVIEDGKKGKAVPLKLKENDGLSSVDSKWLLYSTTNGKSKSSSNQYIKLQDWKLAMVHNKEISNLYSISNLLVTEPKIGISLDYERKTAEQSKLYQISSLRFQKDGSLVVFSSSAPDFQNIPFARVGAENRPWTIKQEDGHFSLYDNKEMTTLKEQLKKTKIAKIILLSPAIWENGSRPSIYRDGKLKLSNQLEVEWLTAAIGRPSLYGGWDIKKHRPKHRKFMVPEGSVIYVKVEEQQIEQFVQLANGFSLTDEGAKEGFGFAVVTIANN